MPVPLDPARLRALAGVHLPTLDGAELARRRHAAGLTVDDLGAWLGRHRSSVQRMERGLSRPCHGVLHLLIILGGTLPWVPWAGWTVVDDALTSPSDPRRWYAPGHLELVTFAWQTCAAARAALREAGLSEAEVVRRVPVYARAA